MRHQGGGWINLSVTGNGGTLPKGDPGGEAPRPRPPFSEENS